MKKIKYLFLASILMSSIAHAEPKVIKNYVLSNQMKDNYFSIKVNSICTVSKVGNFPPVQGHNISPDMMMEVCGKERCMLEIMLDKDCKGIKISDIYLDVHEGIITSKGYTDKFNVSYGRETTYKYQWISVNTRS